MKALHYEAYGGIESLILGDVPTPKVHGDQVRVRVHHAALNPKDVLVRKGRFRWLSGRRFPKMAGLDFAGTVIEGPGFVQGQRVFGALNEWKFSRGTLAEEVVVEQEEVAALPPSISFEDAASLPLVGMTALQALRDHAEVKSGSHVLINGASGGVGTAAIQICVALGAVATSRSSAANLDLCSSLGATTATDYANSEVADCAPYNVIFDVFGNLRFRDVRQHLAPKGVFVSTVPTLRRFTKQFMGLHIGRREQLVVVKSKRKDLEQLVEWLTSGALRAVVESCLPLEGVRDGFRRIETKRTRGKIVVRIDGR